MELKDMIEIGVPIDLKTVSDADIATLIVSWIDRDGNLWPTGDVNSGAFKEKRRREVEAATKKVKDARAKKKKINTNFF